jgi:hypothetical protein
MRSTAPLIEPLENRYAPAAVINIADFSRAEGTSATPGQALILVTLTEAATSAITVNYATMDGTAVAGSDFTAKTGTITFAAGQTQQSISIDIIGDSVDEDNEAFTIQLSNPTGATIDDATATVTITDDDPVLTVSSPTITEGDGATTVEAVFTLALTQPATREITLRVSTGGGTATAGVDYTSITNQLVTFMPGESTKNVSVTVLADNIDEAAETFQLLLSQPTNVVLPNSPTATITDDDQRILSITAPTITEPEGTTPAQAVFTLSLNEAATRAITVRVSTGATSATDDVDAIAGVDYTSITDQLVTFMPGETTMTVSVNILGDALDEATEKFQLQLSSATNVTLPSPPNGVATIEDNDPTPTLTVTGFTILEGDSGTKTANYTITLSAASGRPVTVHAATGGGTAIAGVDYTFIDRDVEFAPGMTTQTVSVPILGDIIEEPDKTVLLTLSAPVNVVLPANPTATGTIADDDIVVFVSDAQGIEGSAGSPGKADFVVRLSAPASHPVTVRFYTQNGSATGGSDFAAQGTAAAPMTLTFAPGDPLSKTISVDFTGDSLGERTEDFLLTLADASGARLADGEGRGTIVNDDNAVFISDAVVVEGGPGAQTAMRFTVTLDRQVAGGAVTVNYNTLDGTATVADSDYTAITNGSLVFDAGGVGIVTRTIDVTIRGDSLSESSETLSLKLSGLTGAGFSADNLADDTGSGTIVDDEVPVVTIEDAQVVEGDAGQIGMIFAVKLSRAADSDVVLNYQTVDGTATSFAPLADFVSVTSSVTIPTGATQALITVQINGELVKEATQNFLVRLTGVESGTVKILDGEATGTIVDNDTTDPVVSLAGASITEGDSGQAHLVFVASLSKPSEVPVTVIFNTQDGSATSPGDFLPRSNVTLTFAPGVTSLPVSVLVAGDTVAEGNHTFTGTLSSPSGATLGAASSATGTILDEDIVVSIADVSVAENIGTRLITVSLSAPVPTGATVTVNFAASAGSATLDTDFKLTTAATSLTFAAGEQTKTISVDIINDTRDEPDEEFTIDLSSPVGAKLGQSQATITITDDDPEPVLTIADATVTEGDAAKQLTFTVTLSAASGRTVTVDVNTAAGTALAGSDFTAFEDPLTLTFAPGETSKTFTVEILGDDIDETVQEFTVNLTNAENATVNTATATATITDDDLRTLSIADVVVVEGVSGTKTVTFTVTLSGEATLPVTVQYGTAAGTATAGEDYLTTMGTLTFNPRIPAVPGDPGTPAVPGETSKTFTVTINGDATFEPDELFTVNLTSPTNATLADGQATGRIQTDEVKYKITPQVGPVAEDGTDGGVVVFTVTRDNGTLAGSVNFTTVDGSAVSTGSLPDYVAKSGVLDFAVGELSKTISVSLTPDTILENDETFLLRLTGSSNGVLVNGADAIQTAIEQPATIDDNDTTRPTMTISNVSLAEGTQSPGTTAFTFTVTLSFANEREVTTVNFATADGTAFSEVTNALLADYTRKTGVLTFEKGEVQKTITVEVNADTRDDADAETFFVNLTDAVFTDDDDNTTPVTLVSAQGIGTILDNDVAPLLSFDSTSFTVNEGNAGQTPRAVKLRLSAASDQPVTVRVDFEAIGATEGLDFTKPANIPSTITFAPGETEKTFDFAILGDTRAESAESLKLTLSDSINAGISTPTTTISITEDDPLPALAVNSVSIVEGNSGTSQLVFTVTLTGASDSTVTVNFATVDGTAKSVGDLKDFLSTSGTLSFAPGETTKTVAVTIMGDPYMETDEAFTLALSGVSNASIAQGTGTATIVQDGDSIIGISILDAKVVEGDAGSSGTRTMTFLVELTTSSTVATTFHAATRNGTAVVGVDYAALSQDFTIAAGQTTQNITVTIGGDSAFEATESLFVTLSDPSSNVIIVGGEARGSILNNDIQIVNAQTIRYVDEDGDLATLQISKGTLLDRFGGLDTDVVQFTSPNSTVGGRILSELNLTGNLTHTAIYNGLDLKLTAAPQPGARAAGIVSDGQVDVGYIHANDPGADFTNGIDINNITVEGDVAKITVGDIQITPSITGVIRIGSLGVRTDIRSDTQSFFLCSVNSIIVEGDVVGSVSVIGGSLGDVNNLRIDGALKGGSATNSGRFDFSGTLLNATIGSIVGGSGSFSGLLSGTLGTSAGNPEGSRIGTLRVLDEVVGGAGVRSGGVLVINTGSVVVGTAMEPGRVAGGTGESSGVIQATARIGNVNIHGDLIGGTGDGSGQIFADATVGQGIGSVRISGSMTGGAGDNSGSVLSNANVGSVRVLGNIQGGTGVASATIQVGRALGSIVLGVDEALTGGTPSALDGNLAGGTGESSGLIAVSGAIGSISIHGDIKGSSGSQSGGIQTTGNIGSLDLRGSLIGGDSNASSASSGTLKSGFISARSIDQAIIGGDITAGTKGSLNLLDSGSIRATNDIASLVVKGNVEGSTTNRVVIAAGGFGIDDPLTPGNEEDATITRLVIHGSAKNLDVLGGYSGAATAENPLGTATNADAQIGVVTFKGSVLGVNVASGISAGADDRIGTTDDAVITGGSASLISRIARVVFKGTISPNSETFGVFAQTVDAAMVGTVELTLKPGAGKDDLEIGPAGSKMRIREFALA